jgi:predicted dehydrogenase
VTGLRVGILGFGYTGRLHLRAWQQTPGIQVVGVAETSAQSRAAVPQGVVAFDECTELLGLDLDAVSICLPTYLHRPAVLAALVKGIHVLVEKPIGVSVAEAEEMIAASRAADRILFVGMTHRFYPEVRQVKQLVDSGIIGQVVLARDCILEHLGFLSLPPWYLDPKAAGGGTVWTSGIHLVDRVVWFMNEAPDRVVGVAGNQFLQQPIEDAAQMLLLFPSGRSAQLSFGFLKEPHPLVCDLEVIGTRGSVVVHTWQGYKVRTAAGVQRKEIYRDEPHHEKVLIALTAEIREFCDAIREGRKPDPSVEESTRALRVAAAFYRSVQSGRMEAVE